jgi:hypothetical protein
MLSLGRLYAFRVMAGLMATDSPRQVARPNGYLRRARGKKALRRTRMEEITAKLVLTQEEIAYIWHGGTLAVKIDAPDMKVSLDLSTSRTSDGRRQSVRIKRVPAKRETA